MKGSNKRGALLAVLFGIGAVLCPAVQAQTVHTSPLNLTEPVRSAFAAFYNMDYASAMAQFDRIEAAHPDDPLATDYVLDVTVFQELNHLDLMDTTFYANDGFLSGKHTVAQNSAMEQRVASLAARAEDQANALLARDSKDTAALFARGWAKSLQATYEAMAERAFVAALKLALSAKNDEEQVLSIDPDYVDADLIAGVYQYVMGSLPFTFRIFVGMAGLSGSKQKGMALLEQAAQHGVITSVEARTCMMLFLRREAKYGAAEAVAASMANEYPHDYLFQLELANLEKDSGDAHQAIAQYQRVLGEARQFGYFHSAHLELAYFGLGDTLRGQKDYTDAAQAYADAAQAPTVSPELKQRCLVAAGKTYDLMHDHSRAVAFYQQAVADGPGTTQGEAASHLIRRPFEGS